MRRRLRTIPMHLILFLVATVTVPVWVVVALLVDTIRWVARRRPFMAIRLFAFGWTYLAVGTWCLVALTWHWVVAGFGRNRHTMREGSYWLQEWWAATLFATVRRIFRLEVTVEGLDRVAPGPIIVLMRHASIVDTLLPNVFVTRGAGIRLRYVLKRELLADPTLDVAGNRLVNHFVNRAGDSSAEVAAVVALASDLPAGEGVLIYPEGTRFTEARRRRILDGLGERSSALADRTRALRRVLPPRPGGPVGLIGAGHDVVVAMHSGLEPLATIPDAWSGRIVGAHLRVRFERFAAATIPGDRRGRLEWLYDRWADLDAWLSS